MKKLLALLAIAMAAAYYMGYDVSDFIPSLPNSAPPPRVRRAQVAAPAAPAPAPQPQQSVVSNAATGSTDDGSLDHRWKTDPSSPTKP